MGDYETVATTEEISVSVGPGTADEGGGVRTDGDGGESVDDSTIREEVPDRLATITADEWKRIQRFAATEEGDRRPDLLVPEGEDPTGTPTHSGATNPVTAERCRRIRRRMRNATTVREVVGEFPKLHRSEIFRHAYGDCGHTHDIPPTASPQLRRRECYAMREAFVEGGTVSEISDEWLRAENTTNRHIFGRCSHDRNPRPLSPSAVPETERTRIVETVAGNKQVGVEDIAAAMRLPRHTVWVVLHGAPGKPTRQLSPSQVPADDRDQILRAFREHDFLALDDIATALRLHPEVVATILALDDSVTLADG